MRYWIESLWEVRIVLHDDDGLALVPHMDHGPPGAVAFVRIGWYRCQGIDSVDKDEDDWIVTRMVLLCLLKSMEMMRFSECYSRGGCLFISGCHETLSTSILSPSSISRSTSRWGSHDWICDDGFKVEPRWMNITSDLPWRFQLWMLLVNYCRGWINRKETGHHAISRWLSSKIIEILPLVPLQLPNKAAVRHPHLECYICLLFDGPWLHTLHYGRLEFFSLTFHPWVIYGTHTIKCIFFLWWNVKRALNTGWCETMDCCYMIMHCCGLSNFLHRHK